MCLCLRGFQCSVAHIGMYDLTDAERRFFGMSLAHDFCNVNGSLLKSLIVQHSLSVIILRPVPSRLHGNEAVHHKLIKYYAVLLKLELG